ncbi:MAG: hypothetical protein IJE43_10670 [Alphaproteobacteria bacterium]|nr:hypothetical protein [Alphaproteobacteria bacterium]MBQ3512566.1 hypothetical protein [Lachnospiraceae bacterium]MBQ4521618.1 hypothetical protein [Lachnospiraceae bacterium]
MLHINNLKEKRLLVVRQLIIKQTELTDENISSVWCDLFPDDKLKLNDTELFEWITKQVNSNGIASCDKQIERIRRKGEKCLKVKCKYVGYGAKLVKQPKNQLATYNIFTKGKKCSGNYESLCRRVGTFSRHN